MEYKEFRKIVKSMPEKEKIIAIILYLKDIKDLLESIVDAKKIKKKHY